MTSLKRLRELALAATQGDWLVEPRNVKYYDGEKAKGTLEILSLFDPEDENDCSFLGAEIKPAEWPGRGNFLLIDALYVALTRPRTLLTLLDIIEKQNEALGKIAMNDEYEATQFGGTDCSAADAFVESAKLSLKALEDVKKMLEGIPN